MRQAHKIIYNIEKLETWGFLYNLANKKGQKVS